MSAASESLVGRMLDGRYRVLSHIADGGMASVFVALDERLDRQVALKVMRPGLAGDEKFVGRFHSEARSAARLSHPNVVAVHDQGSDAGSVFLVMELVNGPTLREVLQAEGPLTPRAALDLLEPVLQALDAAHRAGIIHRDVKPENVILRDDGVVKVADFGLARAVTSATTTDDAGLLLGTVSYLSPEQVERGVADARSDVYACGLVLFEMLTGTKAFTGDTPIHVAYQHVHGRVPVPSERLPTVPPGLDALVAHATARDPGDRPADAGALLALVRRSRAALSVTELDVRPSPGRPGSTVEATVALTRTTVVPPAESRRRLLPWAAVLAVVLLGVAAGLWFLAGPGAKATVPAVVGLPRAQAVQALSRARLSADVTQAFDEQVKAGSVIASDPGSGVTLDRGGTVLLTVSRGPERYAVPGLAGHTQSEAGARLAVVHLAVGTVTGAYDESVPAGQVLSTRPEAGTRVKRGTKVALVVSKGRQPVTVPSWAGKPADDATTALEKSGLTVRSTTQFSTTVGKGDVIAQNPAGGTLYRGDTVRLTVSKGPEMVEVPDVTGSNEEQATRQLETAGFTVKLRRIIGGLFHIVRLQDPAGGTSVPKGSTVTLTIV